MNNIQEMDWAEDCWHGHTGMDSSSDYCTNEDTGANTATEPAPPRADKAAETNGPAEPSKR